eukprot:1599617-Alexandrium_andersonii.AAC.1
MLRGELAHDLERAMHQGAHSLVYSDTVGRYHPQCPSSVGHILRARPCSLRFHVLGEGWHQL